MHHKTTEIYTVLKGEIELTIEGTKHNLAVGDTFVIRPGKVHYVVGDESWIECRSEPGWTLEDRKMNSL
ncbi:cupin domain-containing protein [Candidatus Woesebacteria bacterium]|nr:cupin domain-containing protein [Candidatus Woesebacteria bacterium]